MGGRRRPVRAGAGGRRGVERGRSGGGGGDVAKLRVDDGEQLAGRLGLGHHGVVQRDVVLPLDAPAGLQDGERLVAELLEVGVEDVPVEIDALIGTGGLQQDPLEVVEGEGLGGHGDLPFTTTKWERPRCPRAGGREGGRVF